MSRARPSAYLRAESLRLRVRMLYHLYVVRAHHEVPTACVQSPKIDSARNAEIYCGTWELDSNCREEWEQGSQLLVAFVGGTINFIYIGSLPVPLNL